MGLVPACSSKCRTAWSPTGSRRCRDCAPDRTPAANSREPNQRVQGSWQDVCSALWGKMQRGLGVLVAKG